MTDPTTAVRIDTYDRDLWRCASCGRSDTLQFQHRRATGMGGSKIPPTVVDGLTSCPICNPAYEGRMQVDALWHGWKVRSWVKQPELVPVFYVPEMTWFRLTVTGERYELSSAVVSRFMEAVYGAEWAEWGAKLFGEARGPGFQQIAARGKGEVYGSWR